MDARRLITDEFKNATISIRKVQDGKSNYLVVTYEELNGKRWVDDTEIFGTFENEYNDKMHVTEQDWSKAIEHGLKRLPEFDAKFSAPAKKIRAKSGSRKHVLPYYD